MPLPVDASPWEWVNDPARLAAVAAEVRSAGSMALDLEHHSRRSYLGITCLLQLSTGPSSSFLGHGHPPIQSQVMCLMETITCPHSLEQN